jgi:primary-amine oxidase
MVTLSPTADCPHGTLLAGGKVCREEEDRGVVERFCVGNCATRRGRSLALWSASQMGAYNYTTRWEFHDDGTIEPAVGLSGALQFGDTAHVHNVYWRLDVDVDDSGNDRVEEFYRVKPAGNDGSRGVFAWTPLLGETMRPNDLTTFRKWRVADTVKKNAHGAPWSYELIPHAGDGNFRSTLAEGFTRGELWVTRYKPGERFVSTDTADLLSGYLTGDPIDGQDLVLWYVLHEHHEVRDEDAPYMPMEWVHFTLRPRDFFDDNPMD